jgi:ADP-ribosylglycohydrolase
VLAEAERSASATHDHVEGIRGARAVALAVHLARHGAGKETIRSEIAARFGYDLARSVKEIRPG